MGYKPDKSYGKLGLSRPPGQYHRYKCGESYSTAEEYDSGICTSCFIVEIEAWDNGTGTGGFIDGVWYKKRTQDVLVYFQYYLSFYYRLFYKNQSDKINISTRRSLSSLPPKGNL